MDDVNRLLAETIRGAADRAPSDAGLLTAVHQRSRRYRRRRIATGLSAVAAVVALGVPTVAVLAARSHPSAPLGVVPTASASASASAKSPSPVSSPAPTQAPTASPTHTPPAVGTVKLVAGYTPPVFPYTLPPTDGMKAPVASMADGNLIAFFEATELRHHADTTVTVSSRKPTFATSATETSTRVRGHAGTLRTLDVRPAKQLTLYWPESANRWIQLATDDTYTPQQVVALADSLTAASIAVLPPFTLDLSPAGLPADTISASTMSFRTPTSAPGAGAFSCVLLKRRQLAGTNETVGGYRALLVHNAGGVTLDVDVTDWSATLEVTAPAGIAISDADLLRFAAGVHILDRSDPAP
jgi:hypothetical protein